MIFFYDRLKDGWEEHTFNETNKGFFNYIQYTIYRHDIDLFKSLRTELIKWACIYSECSFEQRRIIDDWFKEHSVT